MKVIGIDEAGRGPVIGPLVVGGVAAREEELEKIEKLQLKDSKRLTPGTVSYTHLRAHET